MAEPASKTTRPRPTSLPTPSTPHAPSPSTPTGMKPRLGPRRQSRFTEDMTEQTPVASVSERSIDYYWYGHSAEDVHTHTTADNTDRHLVPNQEPARTDVGDRDRRAQARLVRLVNSAVHAVPCVVLLVLLGYAMRVLREDIGDHTGVQAILLICFLFADIVLDVVTLLRAQKPWSKLGLGLRFACGIAYITVFLIYIGLGRPFPSGHTYWGMSSGSAALLVYVILCVEGLWNILHVPVCRYQLGGALLRPTPSSPSLSPTLKDRTSFNPRFSTAGTETEHSSISLTWRRWVRTRSTQYSRDDLEPGPAAQKTATREASPDLTLREQPGEEEEEEEEEKEAKDMGGSRAVSTHDEKRRSSGMKQKGDDKWHENRSEETVRPATGTEDAGK
ncbi:hypothetical protein VTG60DRAFT_92 [Thermothelomyces hinnuleus]